jgi:dipeptidyl aminopeptidase/acylaminoacyl peptidase
VQDRSREEQVRVLRELSPINAVTKDMPPTLIFHGDSDPKVPHEQSERFAAKMEANKVPHRLVIRKNAGHGWPEMADDYARMADWFDQRLRPTAAKQK